MRQGVLLDRGLLMVSLVILLIMTVQFIQMDERKRELEGQILDNRTTLAELRTDLNGAQALLLQLRQRCDQ